ncbi:MAG: chromosomal replication initiator protein DnaA [Proteobacteria bacterium]|nr:chromosomal replication initiator protein DnaA [Pseudomonadota bacterium]
MSLWERTKEILKGRFPDSSYSLWIDPLTCIHTDDHVIELAGPDRFFNSWVAEKYLTNIKQGLAELGQGDLRVQFAVAQEDGKFLPPGEAQEQLRLPEMPRVGTSVRALHPKYTFDEFMVGDANMLAHSACQALANNDDSLGRCIFIEAGTGLGKSHLTHSVAHHIINQSPSTRLHYRTAHQLTAEMVQGIKNNTMDQFKDKYYKHCDVLLVEDIHALSGRTKTQEELSGVVDALIESNKRIIFTSAISAKDIQNIDPGFRSRLSSGLITTINPPDLRTRMLIIKRKALNSKLELSDELIEYVADHVRCDIRLIESAVVGVKAKACLLKRAPDLDMVKEVISNIIGRYQDLSTEVIRDFVARQFKVSVSDMRSKSRKKAIAFPRQVTMYLARKLTDQALSDIGKAFNRDHSTVVHSIRVVTEGIARNNSVRGQVELLAKKIKEQFL